MEVREWRALTIHCVTGTSGIAVMTVLGIC